jgi:putative addiction module killer protein
MTYQVEQTEIFEAWHLGLRDLQARFAIGRRIRRAENGNLGVVKSVGEGVSEMKIDMGPGYRLYFTMRGQTVILLLCGGDKHTQNTDIMRAKDMAKEI